MNTLRGWRTSIPLQSSFAALGLATLTTVWTLVNALRVEPIPDPPPTAIASLESLRRAPRTASADVQATVDYNVFSIDRVAPAAPYRLPGEPDPDAKPAVQPDKPIVLGTAVATDGKHFATMQMKDGTPKLVRVGDKIGEWIVRGIERGKVVLVSTGGVRAELAVTRPGF